jgi:hypothetical protein
LVSPLENGLRPGLFHPGGRTGIRSWSTEEAVLLARLGEPL